MATVKKKFEITKGEDLLAISLFFVYKNGRPFNLTGATEIEIKIPTDGVALSKKLSLTQVTIIDAKLGHVTIDISDTESATFKKGASQHLLGIWDKGTEKRKFNFNSVMDVLDPAVA